MLLQRHWVSVGLEIYDVLCEVIGGEDRVCETLVMPFTGVINYVLRKDGKSLMDFKTRKLLELKQLNLEDRGKLVVFYMIPSTGEKVNVKCGGKRVLNRLLRKMGYIPISIELEDWSAF